MDHLRRYIALISLLCLGLSSHPSAKASWPPPIHLIVLFSLFLTKLKKELRGMLHLKQMHSQLVLPWMSVSIGKKYVQLDPTHASPQIDNIIVFPLLGTIAHRSNVSRSSITKYVEQRRHLDLHANGLCVSTIIKQKKKVPSTKQMSSSGCCCVRVRGLCVTAAFSTKKLTLVCPIVDVLLFTFLHAKAREHYFS